MSLIKHYILNADHTVREAGLDEWAAWMETASRRVARTTVHHPDPEQEDSEVSTVFLGLDHNFGDKGDPVLFETLVFGGPMDREMDRYRTWDEAVAGHNEMVKKVRRRLNHEDD